MTPGRCVQVDTWSSTWKLPDQIAGRLRVEFPNDSMVHVSHEAIASHSSSNDVVNCVVSRSVGCAYVRFRNCVLDRPCAKGEPLKMVTKSGRPTEMVDGPVRGYWEGDFIRGSPAARDLLPGCTKLRNWCTERKPLELSRSNDGVLQNPPPPG